MSLFAFAALAVSLPVSALELDRIEVKSGIGQPLLAEIPVVSADSSELQKLQARLASPATFARIGLERPRGVVASLQFRLARDARGKPVIRVTSTVPVERDFLTFLVQVDWGEGRMVREYSLSLSAPDTLASPMPPRIEAPRMAMPNTIMRAPGPTAISSAIPLATDVQAADVTAPSAVGAAAAPIPLAAPAVAPVPAAAKPVAPAAQPAPPSRHEAGQGRKPESGDYGPIRAGDTLSAIAGTFADDRHTLNQAMLALLRVNPDAFIAGNINLLRRGAILRAPQPEELSRYSAAEATAMVREQIRSWREGRPVPPQPAALPPATTYGADTAPATKAPRVAAPRLEISPGPDDALFPKPAAAAGAGAGFDEPQAFIAGPGEPQTARDAEIMELRARVSELDQLQQQQQALLALKNKELAARPASRAGAWPWLATAFAMLMPIAWWLGRRGRGPGLPRAGDHGAPGVSAAGDEEVNGNEPVPVDEPGSAAPASPAWHSTARRTASVVADV
ncbi:FimV family protein [Luteimonas soli]|uniref:FimV family protein n=1 Tax=Luteimonas soli TaxID=1648966 RepID=A0ABV7XGC9_9GAMM